MGSAVHPLSFNKNCTGALLGSSPPTLPARPPSLSYAVPSLPVGAVVVAVVMRRPNGVRLVCVCLEVKRGTGAGAGGGGESTLEAVVGVWRVVFETSARARASMGPWGWDAICAARTEGLGAVVGWCQW